MADVQERLAKIKAERVALDDVEEAVKAVEGAETAARSSLAALKEAMADLDRIEGIHRADCSTYRRTRRAAGLGMKRGEEYPWVTAPTPEAPGAADAAMGGGNNADQA